MLSSALFPFLWSNPKKGSYLWYIFHTTLERKKRLYPGTFTDHRILPLWSCFQPATAPASICLAGFFFQKSVPVEKSTSNHSSSTSHGGKGLHLIIAWLRRWSGGWALERRNPTTIPLLSFLPSIADIGVGFWRHVTKPLFFSFFHSFL